MTEFRPDPVAGRIFRTSRSVRTTDVTGSGRLRLDAIARYLQEAAEDDVLDAGWDDAQDWLLRRCVLSVRRYPAHGQRLRLRTYCSALGPRWAERTTTLSDGDADLIQATAVWVAVSRQTGSPAPLGRQFHRVYGPSAQGRTITARLFHPGPGGALGSRPWPLRASDIDTAGHVNNTVHWAAAEDALAGLGWVPAAAEIEYRQPILPGCEPELRTSQSPGGLDVWLTAGTDLLASARLAAALPR